METERFIALAPAIARRFVAFDDNGWNIELTQARAQGDASLTSSDDNAIGLLRITELRYLLVTLFFPRLAVAVGSVFHSFRSTEAHRLLVALEFGHRRQECPDFAILQTNVTGAARDVGLEFDPAFDNAVCRRRVLALRNFPLRRLYVAQPRLQHLPDLVSAFHGLDVPRKGHEIAPVAVCLEETGSAFCIFRHERIVQFIEQVCDLLVRCLVEHVFLPSRAIPLRTSGRPQILAARCSGPYAISLLC